MDTSPSPPCQSLSGTSCTGSTEGADSEDEEEISAFASAELNNKDEAEAECWKIADLPEKLWLEAVEAHMLKGTKWDNVVAYVVLRFFIRTGADLDMAADYYHDMNLSQNHHPGPQAAQA